MRRDPSLLPIATVIQPDPFPPAEVKSGVSRRDELLRAAHESLATFVLEQSGVVLPANAPFEHDAVCGSQTTISTPAEECAMHLAFAISAIEAAYKLDPDDSFRADALGMICELRIRVRALRGEL